MAGGPVALQCELPEPTGQVSWCKDGTELLPQSGVDFQSEGNLKGLVVPSAELAQNDVYRCESKNAVVEFAVKVEGDAQKPCSASTDLHCQLTVTAVWLIKSYLINNLTDYVWFFYFSNLVNYFSKNVKQKLFAEILT